jgi:hypothetical protein
VDGSDEEDDMDMGKCNFVFLCRGYVHAREDERNAALKTNVRIIALAVF